MQMKQSSVFLSFGLVTLCLLISCARPPGQIVEAPAIEAASKPTKDVAVIRMEGAFGVASGFFVESNKIVTNIHVAALPGVIFARSTDRETLWRVDGVTAFDVKNDLVILKVDGEAVPLRLADSGLAEVGEPVIAIGYPNGKYRVTRGEIYGTRSSDKWIQMRIELSGGNSGGPIQNRDGHVIGIVSGVETPYSYAIPSNALSGLIGRSGTVEPLNEWRQRSRVRAYVYAVQGQTKYADDRYAEAVTDFDNAIRLDPEQPDAYYNRGLAKFQLGELQFARGNIERAQMFYEDGIKDSTQAIQLDPEDAYAYHNRAGGQYRLGQFKVNQGDVAAGVRYYQSAIQDWTQVIERNPELADPYNNRGITNAALADLKVEQAEGTAAWGLYTAAIRDCTTAIGLDPRNAAAYSSRGAVKAALGDAEGAIADFDTAIRLSPMNAQYLYARGRVKAAAGQTEAAESDFEKARALDPNVEP